jgi:hypothetical protein
VLRRSIFALLLAACDGGSTSSALDVQLVRATGANAAADVEVGTLTVHVRQDDRRACEDAEDACTTNILDGRFELRLPIGALDENTWAQVEIAPETGTPTFGATPVFRPFGDSIDVNPVIRIVMEPASRCEPLMLDGLIFGMSPDLQSPRTRAAVVVRRNLALIVGGEGDNADRIERFDQLTFDSDTLEDTIALGPSRGLSLNENVSIVVGDGGAIRFDVGNEGVPPVSTILGPNDASSLAALVLSANGGAIVAGEMSRDITWLNVNGQPRAPTSLAVARTNPAAVGLDEDLLVVGGHADGDAAAEWVQNLGDGEALDLPMLPLGRGGVLLPSPDGQAVLWIAFEIDGVPSEQTWLIHGCPGDACAAQRGPDWPRPRTGVATVITAAGTLWIGGGGRAIDLVRWEGDDIRIEEGPELAVERTFASVFEHASGTVVFAGGMTDSFEMCFPAALDPL